MPLAWLCRPLANHELKIMNTKGNTILITGGTSGIGRAFAEAFVQEGNKVIICGRRNHRLNEIKNSLPDIIAVPADVSDEKQRTELAQWVIANYPETNMLVNNAGVQLLAD